MKKRCNSCSKRFLFNWFSSPILQLLSLYFLSHNITSNSTAPWTVSSFTTNTDNPPSLSTPVTNQIISPSPNNNHNNNNINNLIRRIMGQTISATQFFVYGKRHFTQTGYLKHVQSYYKEPVQVTSGFVSKTDPTYDNVDMSGKVVVITGANSGLGKEVATYVTSKGAKVYMLCRSVERAQTARSDIIKAATGTSDEKETQDRVIILPVDVGELTSVRKVVQEIQQRESSIHCLVCNAGVLLNEQQNTVDQQLESTFASHLLGGTYLLTSLLLPQLQSTPDSRVVVVTSGGMYTTPLPNWDVMTSYTTAGAVKPDNYKYDGTMAYAYAKRGQVVLVEEWSKKYGDTTKFVTVHPGWSDTPAVADAFGDNAKYLQPLRHPWQGAEGVAWCTRVPNAQLVNGGLYLDRQVQKKHIAGPFMTEGSYTKNTPSEIQSYMEHLQQAAGLVKDNE